MECALRLLTAAPPPPTSERRISIGKLRPRREASAGERGAPARERRPEGGVTERERARLRHEQNHSRER
jgi:hypothetical protein